MESLVPIIPTYAKWIMTIILSIISIILFISIKSYARKQSMIAMILSTIGDFFMTNMFGLEELVCGAFGGAFFIAAHIVYATTFTNLNKQHGWNYKNIGVIIAIVLAIVSVIVETIFMFLRNTTFPIMYPLLMIYTAIIAWNMCSIFSYSFNSKNYRTIILPIAITIFYLTDVWIFINMLKIYTLLRDVVWYLYPIAQLLLILFIEPFKKPKELEYIREK